MSSSTPLDPGREPRSRRLGLLSTYPPRLCGLATFAAALELELAAAGDEVVVVAIENGRHDRGSRSRVRSQHVNGNAASVRETADVLSQCDVAIIQHEYGIYGGVDGDEVLDVLRMLDVASIVVLHTVPSHPTPNQRSVLETVCDLATSVVVMSEAARSRLTERYDVDAIKVNMIPHGAASPPFGSGSGDEARAGRAQLLTWGLLGPGKGIEHMVRAMASLHDLRPRVRYTVAGATHPNVFARDGDQYRESLIRAAWATGVAGAISFDDTYRDVPTLTRFVASSTLVVLPYDSRDQVTSGVLVDAIAAGRPVIATAFPHAVELLSGGAGIVVPHRDPEALATAIRFALEDQSALDAMAGCARRIAPSLTWRTVAAQYRSLCDSLDSAAAMAAM